MLPESVLHVSPRIVKNELGIAVFEGTGIKIWMIVDRAKTASSVSEALDDFLTDFADYEDVTEAHFKAAERYYIQNQAEIDEQLEKNYRISEEASIAQTARINPPLQ